MPCGLILLYHRIGTESADPWSLCVSPRRFAEHLEIIGKYGRPVPLWELATAVREGKCRPRAVAVTLDDGYADNLYNAKPLLERAGIPATVFIITSYLTRMQEFWWDELERIFLQPGTLPANLTLEGGGRAYEWQLGKATEYTIDEAQNHTRWNASSPAKHDPGVRQHIYRSVYGFFRHLDEGARQDALASLRRWAAKSDLMPRPTHRPLSTDEVVQLARGGLIEIGAHTRTHPVLVAYTPDRQRIEISESKSMLEEIVQRPVMSFAYPYGSRAEYNSVTRALVRKAGFSCACSARLDAVWPNCDPFEFPRISIENWDGDTFGRLLVAGLKIPPHARTLG